MHDASEAYLGHVIKPLKVILGKSYTDIEDRFMDIICRKFKIHSSDLVALKEFDKIALEIEFEVFFESNFKQWSLAWDIDCHLSKLSAIRNFKYSIMKPETAYINFIEHFNKLKL